MLCSVKCLLLSASSKRDLSANTRGVLQNLSVAWLSSGKKDPRSSSPLQSIQRTEVSGGDKEPTAALTFLGAYLKRLSAVPTVPAFLGFAGAIPFLVLSPPIANTLSVFLPYHVVENAALFQVAYASTIISFLGAVHWGMAMASTLSGPIADRINTQRYTWSVLPCLMIWPALAMEPAPASLIATILLPACYYVDKHFARRGYLPNWYMSLRTPLTALASFGLATTTAYYFHLHQEQARLASLEIRPKS